MGIIRALLAVYVVLAHTPIKQCHPFNAAIAVQVFYIISGFYMALILSEKYVGKVKAFFTNRTLRLLPLYLLVAGLQLGAYFAFGFPAEWHFARVLSPFTVLALVFTNICIVGQDIMMFLGIHIYTGQLYFTSNFYQEPLAAYKYLLVPQCWSVGCEILFYAIVPLLVKCRSRVLVGIIASSILLRIIGTLHGLYNDPWNYRFFPFECALFVTGILSYRLYAYLKVRTVVIPSWIGWCGVGGFIFLTLFSRVFPVLDNNLVPLVAIAVLIPALFFATGQNKVDRYIGELSYAIYVTHILVIRLATKFIPHASTSTVILLLTIPAAMLLQYAVERPIRAIRDRVAAGKPLITLPVTARWYHPPVLPASHSTTGNE